LFLPEQKARRLIILCHGFLGDKRNHGRTVPWARNLNAGSSAVLAFDFAGCGESSGDFAALTFARQCRDLTAVIGWAGQNLSLPVLLLGRSLGGAVILSAAGRPDVKGLVFWSAAIKLEAAFRRSLGDRAYETLAAGTAVEITREDKLTRLFPDFIHSLADARLESYYPALAEKPALIIQGGADEVVTPDNAWDLLSLAAAERGEYRLFPDADHAFTGCEAEREVATSDWLRRHFGT
jgi:alpha-beta hydrolase superfamily lysophospholipase